MVTYSHLAGPEVAARIEGVVELYEVVYKEPPYGEGPEQVSRFRESLHDELARAGFSAIIAIDDNAMVGFAYGWTMPAGTWWSRADAEPGESIKNADKFAVMEWIVHPRRRGEGIGSELIRRLLAGLREPYATLASDPRSAARRMYARAGWLQVATTNLSWGPAMDLLVFEQINPSESLA